MVHRLTTLIRGAGSRIKLARIEWLSRFASIMLTATLALSTAFALASTNVTEEIAGQVDTVRTMTGHLHAAQYALQREQSLEREYRLNPQGSTFVAHRAAASQLVAAMQAVRDSSDSTGRRAAERIIARHRLYLDATRRMFVATNRDDLPLVTAIQRDQVDPVFDDIDDTIDALAKAQAVVADNAIEKLHRVQHWVLSTTAALSLLGLTCLACFLSIVWTYRLRLKKSHEADLDRAHSASLIDPLTGIGNHRAYKVNLLRETSRSERHHEHLTLVLLDVDDFKIVNDRDGHMQGDRVLESLARLLGSLRTEDRAYRIGGDEFALILPHTSQDAAMEVAEQLRVAVALSGNTVSIGLATLNDTAGNAEELQSQADAAMYAAKRSGRNAVRAFDDLLDGALVLSSTKVQNLKQLITSQAVGVEFQPIWDARRCRVLAYEALARPNPDFGFKGPLEAFDLAERVGRAHELDAVCREATFRRAAALPAGALLFLNVAPQSLDHGRLSPRDLLAAVSAAGLTPDRIVIEITERSISQVETVIAAAIDLRQHGFRLALDDTGAGNSGLEMLSRLPLDFVKIDGGLVVKALTDKKARGVVAGIIAIARATDAYVIAEGIETTALLAFVCNTVSQTLDLARGVQGVQGYLLQRPREAFLDPSETDDFAALLREFTMGVGKETSPQAGSTRR